MLYFYLGINLNTIPSGGESVGTTLYEIGITNYLKINLYKKNNLA